MYIYYIDFTYTPKLHRHWHIHPDTFPSACSLYALLVTHHYKLSAVWMVKSSCCWSIAVLPLKNRWNIILKICKCARVQINITHILHRYRYIYIYICTLYLGFNPPFWHRNREGGAWCTALWVWQSGFRCDGVTWSRSLCFLRMIATVPSGKLTYNYGKSQFLMGKSTIHGHVQ